MQENLTLVPTKIDEKIKIDGDLDENIWQLLPLSEEFITFSPVYGDKLGAITKVGIAYDDQNLYFAFKCLDDEPEKVKTTVSKRDSQSNDDWIGVLIDGMGNRQSTYEFYCNANGIQIDGITSATNANVLDIAYDFVWESAGKITASGYQVEIRLPLSSLRFKGGEETTMGIMFMRSISRFGKMGAWPEIKAGQNQFNFMADSKYQGLEKMLNLEILPNITLNRDREHDATGAWDSSENDHNLGVSVKYGITSAVTAEATINPDFSQVESDAYQVEVNQRYPIFYTEKRPFFMEGVNAFDFALVNNGMMLAPVYTRFIIDPALAAKLSGTAGRMQFALLAADDEAPGRPWEQGSNPDEGVRALWGLARSKYSLGDDNSAGLLYCRQQFAGSVNQVAGADLQYRFFDKARLTLSYLHSINEPAGTDKTHSGLGINAMLQYDSRRVQCWTTYERWDEHFSMASAFMNRTGIDRGQFFFGYNLYPGKIRWAQRIQPRISYETVHDLVSGMNDYTAKIGATLYTVRSGIFQALFYNEQEAWAGTRFKSSSANLVGLMQLTNYLYTYASFKYGDKIYYDPEEPFLGMGHRLRTAAIVQPHVKLNVDLEWIQDVLSRRLENKKHKIYTVNIFNVSTTYQFNKYFFIRTSLRYNDYEEKLLSDFLASFTLIPGTVLHMGYGALFEETENHDGQKVYHQKWREIRNSLFFKCSYLLRIQ
ncbi:carbohydrate binding family 9 domain-containing protein [candidate division KSB1 bacterium]|nr:carbohydrate binding family 9 domain-containing protein [candidate division KSB1 bacterium]